MTTIYLDLDGRRRPVLADCQNAFEPLADAARRRARAEGGEPAAHAVTTDLDRMRAWLADLEDRAQVRGVALFASTPRSRFEVVELPSPVRDQADVGPAPHLLQLAAAVEEGERCLTALVDRRNLRLLQIELGEVAELPALSEPDDRAVDTNVELGGFERYRTEVARGHLRRAAAAVERALAASGSHRLVLAGPDEALAGLEAQLAPAARHTIAGRAGIAVSAPGGVVRDAALAVLATAEHRREVEVVEEVRERTATGDGGVTGLDDTFAALARRTVSTLVVAEGFSAPGSICPSCGWRGAAVHLCPVCRAVNGTVGDIVGLAVAEALAQGARVVVCRGTDLDRFGRIGALERWTGG